MTQTTHHQNNATHHSRNYTHSHGRHASQPELCNRWINTNHQEGLLCNAETRLNELDGTSAKGYFKANSKEDSQHKLSLINVNIVESYFDMDSGHYEETRYKHPRVINQVNEKWSNKMTLVNFDHYAGKKEMTSLMATVVTIWWRAVRGKTTLMAARGMTESTGYGNDIIVGGAGRSDRAEFIRNGIPRSKTLSALRQVTLSMAST